MVHIVMYIVMLLCANLIFSHVQILYVHYFNVSLRRATSRGCPPPKCEVHASCVLSVLRPGSERLARARLTASYCVYRSWLRSISACNVTSYRIEHVQATALGPHSCRLELNILSKSRPGLFYPTFCRSDSKKVIVAMDFEDLSEGLRISLFVLNLHAED